jgi:transcriptional regulator with XRE-family HTH domain
VNQLNSLPGHTSKGEFAKRLYKAMISAGLSQSELGRQADIHRSLISAYINGRNFPDPQNLERLAKALRVPAEELLPKYIEQAIKQDRPAVSLRASPQAPDRPWLQVNRMVTFQTGAKIIELLANDKTESDYDLLPGNGTTD